ncbi:hypothetical protein PC118_g9347 [Phytophthora cactorum]|uniref:Uncharacterized protein n=1 Tax=Phytophthora cactorum TaxID=29920 RepID=A0A8T0Z6T6_9STRA|nr:hypothetical protein PC113_g10078 [Phytophthora cactorum]KAG2983584.1 hypothetical protein PC118_g9347 [Phytophthora cactorum]
MLCFCRVNDGGLTRNTWASFSKSLAVLLRRTLWPVVEPGNAYSLTHHTDKSLVFFSNEVWVNKTIVECRLYRKLIVESLIQRTSASQPVRPYADQLQLTSFVLLQTVDGYAKRKQDKRSKFSERSSLQLCVACGCFLRCCGGVGALLWKVQIAVKQWMSDAAWHF